MEKLFESIDHLTPQSQQAVRVLVRQLCENEGINIPPDQGAHMRDLMEGITLWEAWMVPQCQPGTIRLYKRYIKLLLTYDPKPTAFSIQQRQAAELLGGMSATAVKNEYKAIKSFFTFIYDQGLCPSNPVKGIKPPRVPRREVKAPSPDDVRKLLAVVDTPKLGAMLALFLDTGIRFSELACLTWEQVNLDTPEITVIGKGNKERTIPISPLICDILGKMISDLDKHGYPFVFPSQSISGWDNRDANRSLARLCRKAGIKKYTCHQLRHFFANFTMEHGGEGALAALSAMLGHSDRSTTVDYYLDADKKKIKEVHGAHTPFSRQGEMLQIQEGQGE